MQAQILAPAAVLVVWSIVMLAWMAAIRLPAMQRAGAGLGKVRPGGRGQDLEGVLDDRVNWKAHNYAHLMEQPTLFYAVSAILAIMGAGPTEIALAWGYVGLRIVHSLWQASVNTIPVRFTLFVLSTILLGALAMRALALTLFNGQGPLA